MDKIQQIQTALGPLGALLVPFAVGIILGTVFGSLFGRRRKEPEITKLVTVGAKSLEPIGDVESVGQKTDGRRNPRRVGKSVEVFVTLPGEAENPLKGVVLNRSVGGLGLLVGDEYKIGTMVGVMPVLASQFTAWVEVEVMSCRRHGQDWEIGVKFLKVPPYSVMVMFG